MAIVLNTFTAFQLYYGRSFKDGLLEICFDGAEPCSVYIDTDPFSYSETAAALTSQSTKVAHA